MPFGATTVSPRDGVRALFWRLLASIARAHSEWFPATAVQAYEYGLVESLLARTASMKNSTRRIPEASLAFAPKVTSCPMVSVEPAAGPLKVTVGGVVSRGAATFTTERALALLPAASVAIASST